MKDIISSAIRDGMYMKGSLTGKTRKLQKECLISKKVAEVIPVIEFFESVTDVNDFMLKLFRFILF